MSNLVLIGLKNAGKTSTSIKLAKDLGYQVLDTDVLLVAKYNQLHRKPVNKITDIYLEVGEQQFRDLEYTVVKEHKDIENTIFATGGGTIINPKCWPVLKNMGTNIFLYLDKSTFISRILIEKNINYLRNRDLFDIYNFRQKIYEQLADITINVSKLSIDDICHTIKQKMR